MRGEVDFRTGALWIAALLGLAGAFPAHAGEGVGTDTGAKTGESPSKRSQIIAPEPGVEGGPTKQPSKKQSSARLQKRRPKHGKKPAKPLLHPNEDATLRDRSTGRTGIDVQSAPKGGKDIQER